MLKLNVGISRKVGLPGYSSAGASCNMEFELPPELLRDPPRFREQVRDAYAAANRAVDDELLRLQSRPGLPADDLPDRAGGRSSRRADPDADAIEAARNGDRSRPGKAATARQLRAIAAIARRRNVDLVRLLRDGFGVGRPEDLSLADASTLIDRMNATAGT